MTQGSAMTTATRMTRKVIHEAALITFRGMHCNLKLQIRGRELEKQTLTCNSDRSGESSLLTVARANALHESQEEVV